MKKTAESEDDNLLEKQIISDVLNQIKRELSPDSYNQVLLLLTKAEELEMEDYIGLSLLASNDQKIFSQVVSLLSLSKDPEYSDFIKNIVSNNSVVTLPTRMITEPITTEKVIKYFSSITAYLSQAAINTINFMERNFIAKEDQHIVINAIIGSFLKSTMEGFVSGNLKIENFIKGSVKATITSSSAVQISKQVKALKENNKERQAKIYDVVSKKTLNILIDSLEKGLVQAATKEAYKSTNQIAQYILYKKIVPVIKNKPVLSIVTLSSLLTLAVIYFDEYTNVLRAILQKTRDLGVKGATVKNVEKSLVKAIELSINKGVYNFGWVNLNGKIAFDQRDFNQAIMAYVAAKKLENITKENFIVYGEALFKNLKDYVEHELHKRKNITDQEKTVQILSEIQQTLVKQRFIDESLAIEHPANLIIGKIQNNQASADNRISLDSSNFPLLETQQISSNSLSIKLPSIDYIPHSKNGYQYNSENNEEFGHYNAIFTITSIMLFVSLLKLCGYKNNIIKLNNPVKIDYGPKISQEENYSKWDTLLNRESKSNLAPKRSKKEIKHDDENNAEMISILRSINFQQAIKEAKMVEANLRKITEKDLQTSSKTIKRKPKNKYI